jgi:hypothetical protein
MKDVKHLMVWCKPGRLKLVNVTFYEFFDVRLLYKYLRRLLVKTRHSKQVFNSLTPKSVPAGTKTPFPPVRYVGIIVRLSYASHISHPTKTTTMVKPLLPPSAWV